MSCTYQYRGPGSFLIISRESLPIWNINLYHSWILTALLKQLLEHQRLPSICYTHYWEEMRYTLNNMDLFPLCELYVHTEKLNCLAAAHRARRRSGTPTPQLGFSYTIYPRHYTGYTILCSRESAILDKYVNFIYLFQFLCGLCETPGTEVLPAAEKTQRPLSLPTCQIQQHVWSHPSQTMQFVKLNIRGRNVTATCFFFLFWHLSI